MLFFVSVGMLIDPAFLLEEAVTILAVVLLVFLVKGMIFAGLARAFGYGNIVPFAAGLGLFQVGEFSFVLARVGISTGALTPFAARLAPVLYGWWRERSPAEPLETIYLPEMGLKDQVIIVGCGRVGNFVAQMLRRLGRAFVTVDMDPARVDAAREE